MQENVFDNASKSLNNAKIEMRDLLEAENARHELTINLENEFHSHRVLEINQILSKLDERSL